MMQKNQKKSRSLVSVCAMVAIISLLVFPSVSNADDEFNFSSVSNADNEADSRLESNVGDNINFYHTYHNDLGGKVITNCQLGVDFMEKYFSLWIDDGQREWYVVRTGLGYFFEYGEGDCKLYTNSFSVKLALYIAGLKNLGGFACIEQDLQ